MIRPGKERLRLETEVVNCGVCGHADRRRIGTERYRLGQSCVPLGINRCRACAQVYVSPRLTEESTELVYRLDQNQTISHNYCWAGPVVQKRFWPLIQRLRQQVPTGRLLDLGCGAGHFLAAAEEWGNWQLLGIDPSADAIDQARKLCRSEVQQGTIDNLSVAGASFDVVVMLGVLEHLHEPRTTLQRVRRLIRPGGCLAVYVPNFHYLRWKDRGLVSLLRNGRWSHLAPQEHLFQFTPTTLGQLLRNSGFIVKQLDVGRPFTHGPKSYRVVKEAAYFCTKVVYHATGLHLGGLEAIAHAPLAPSCQPSLEGEAA